MLMSKGVTSEVLAKAVQVYFRRSFDAATTIVKMANGLLYFQVSEDLNEQITQSAEVWLQAYITGWYDAISLEPSRTRETETQLTVLRGGK